MSELHFLSGGIDSTAILYRRLNETKEDVHVLHVRAEHLTRGAYETQAARQIVVWLAKNVRQFTYVEVIYNPGKITCSNGLFSICGLLAAQYVIKNPYIAQVIQGTNLDDQSEDSLARNRYREAICTVACDGYAPAPTWVCPHEGLTKLDVYRGMPPALRDLCVTCVLPVQQGGTYVACEKCPKCLEMKAVKEAA